MAEGDGWACIDATGVHAKAGDEVLQRGVGELAIVSEDGPLGFKTGICTPR